MSKEPKIKGERDRQIINNLTIRAEELPDYSKIALVNNLAFEQENEAQLIDKIRHSDRYIPELSLVAVLDEKIIGHIIFSYIDLIAQEVTQVLALAPVAVLPEYQNKGIGSLLIQTGLEIADKILAPIVIVLGDAKFYARFGFKPASDYGIQSPFDVPNEYFMVKFLTQDSKNYRGKIRCPLAFNNV
ncbi:MAG TPA: N-acetyltransferase [Coleofasciculaceae cyanobacterium]|jgi:putative acetyltransferase